MHIPKPGEAAMTVRQSVAVWFEIPAKDFDRAARFYERILGVTLRRDSMGPMTLGIFPYEEPNASGCIIAGPNAVPGKDGPIVYLNADGVLEKAIDAAWEAGGEVITPVTELPDGMGRFAHLRDTEGNRIGLHAA
jgi:uncharacterized protein